MIFSAQFPALYASGGCNLLLIDERAHGLMRASASRSASSSAMTRPVGALGARAHSRVQRPIALYGVSMGAASVLLAAQLPELKS